MELFERYLENDILYSINPVYDFIFVDPLNEKLIVQKESGKII